MQKIIHITDPHISGKNPICRLDNLVEVQFKKLKELIKIANKEESPIICTGDITDSPNISYSTFSKLADILSKCKYNFYILYGNHDLLFHSLDSVNATALGALIKSVPSIKHISEFIYDYGIPIDFEDWNDQRSITTNDISKILVCHRAVIKEKMVSRMWMKENQMDFYYSTDKELKKYDLILCGHFHKQYRFNEKNYIVLNPGSFTRRKSNEIEIHEPSYYHISYNNNNISYVLNSIPNCKGIKDVMSDSHLTYTRMTKNIKGEIANFFHKFKINKEKNQFKSTLTQTFNSMKEGELKETLREILIKVYGDIEIGEIEYGSIRTAKTKKHNLKIRTE
jgi:DNA repair exonuclease SbcCD nuclease subunit